MSKLKREIGFGTLLFLTVNSIIGTGIFFLPAHGASFAGPASIISWSIGSLIAIMIAMYFAELVSMFPKAGGVYEYSKQAFGKFPSFLVGWMSWIIANVTISMVIVGAIQYILPDINALLKITSALSIVAFFNYISYKGIKLSTVVLLIFGIITTGTLLAIIVPGVPEMNTAFFTPLVTHPTPMIFLAVLFIIETFFGWETTTFLAEEIKNPRKVMPRALVLGTAAVIVLTMGIVFAALGNVHWTEMQYSKAPLSDVAEVVLSKKAAFVVEIAAFLAILGTAAGWIVTTPRLLMAISRDKLFPSFCEKIHPKYNTPYKAIALQALVTSFLIVIGFGSYHVLLEILLPLVLIMYSAVMASMIKLRFSKKRAKRFFKAPFGIVGPSIVILFNLSLLVAWMIIEPHAIAIVAMGLLFVTLGFPFYIFIRLIYDRRFKERFFDWFSYTWDKLFPIWYGKNEMDQVVQFLDLKKSDVILDYGCYTGMTTKKLSETVGTRGTIVAVDLSRKSLELAEKKTWSNENVILIKEKEIIPFKKETFDGITLVSVIEQFDDPVKQLRMLRKILKTNKSISALAFGKVFFLPSPDHLQNVESIENLFSKAGFRKIKIYRKWKLFSEYYFIKATK